MTDIVERLRAKHDDTWPQQIGYGDLINQDGPEAADEIERLRKERSELLEALEAIIARWDTPAWKDVEPTAEVINRARASLSKAQ